MELLKLKKRQSRHLERKGGGSIHPICEKNARNRTPHHVHKVRLKVVKIT
jgi:hypothetical protein